MAIPTETALPTMDERLDAWLDEGSRIAELFDLASLSATVITEDDREPYLKWRAVDLHGQAKTSTRTWGE